MGLLGLLSGRLLLKYGSIKIFKWIEEGTKLELGHLIISLSHYI